MKTIVNSTTEIINEIEISDQSFTRKGWLQISIGDKSAEVHINDLLPAIIGFDAKFSREKEIDS